MILRLYCKSTTNLDEEEPEEVEERAVEKKNNNGKGKQILEKLKILKFLQESLQVLF